MSDKSNWLWRSLSLLLILTLAFTPILGVTAQDDPPPDAAVKGSPATETAVDKTDVSREDALAKLDPALLSLAKGSVQLPEKYGMDGSKTQEPVIVIIMGKIPDTAVDKLQSYFVDGKLAGFMERAPAGFQRMVGLIMPSNLLKVASSPYVQAIYDGTPKLTKPIDNYPIDDTVPPPSLKDWEELRANADGLREGSLSYDEARDAADDAPADWYEVSPTGPAKAELAWARGVTGAGVRVAVLDDGVDFAHPDLIGTQVIYNEATCYGADVFDPANGVDYRSCYPYIMDAFSMFILFLDSYFGTSYVAYGQPGTSLVDTSATPPTYPCGPGVSCFDYTPLIDYDTPGTMHSYRVDPAMSASGVFHVGTHQDESLRDYVWGEKVAVLVTDPHQPGVYDTVYVDLDNDYDFRDEKPTARAGMYLEGKNDPISYRDFDGDGKADLSGGALYFISDGSHWLPAMDWLWVPQVIGLTPPGPGDLVGLYGPWDSGYSHGTNCASNVVGQGIANANLPSFADLPPGPGVPAGAVFGAAIDAGLVGMGNIYWNYDASTIDSYLLAAIGWDGVDQNGMHFLYGVPFVDTDPIQITSNSYGSSASFNDGWDWKGLIIEDIMREYAPSTQYLFSTGNGGPGYGTAAPPSPGLGILVGASTEYGSTGWDSITYTHQINYNDMAAFSNSGPGTRDGAGVDVVAGGAFAAGSEELNYFTAGAFGTLDGNASWATWGGTSRSAPFAMGVLALIYDAYKQKHGVFPTADVAKSIFMSTATDINYDVFKQGAGAVNADTGSAAALGQWGLYADGSSADWTPGDWRGLDFESFAHIAKPGDLWEKSFTLVNDSPAEITAYLTPTYLQKVDTYEFDLVVTPEDVANEGIYGPANRDNFYKAFQYYIPLYNLPDSKLPEGALDDIDLMVVRQVYPFEEFDVDQNYNWDNRYYLMVYDWMDYNQDGNVWEDHNSNGVVNFINSAIPVGNDAGFDLDWADPRTELDRWEYERYGYNRPTGNANELGVQNPLGRMHDGLFIGLRHLYNDGAHLIDTHLSYRVELYKRAEVDWLATNTDMITIPAGGDASFTGLVSVPPDMPAGDYAAEIEVFVPGTEVADVSGTTVEPYSANNLIIPVTLHVSAAISDIVFNSDPTPPSPPSALTLGGEAAYIDNDDTTYNNGAVRGYFDWGWRAESGDWRMFYLDAVSGAADTTEITPLPHIIVRDQWDAPAPWTDIDTIVLGPNPSGHPSMEWEAGNFIFDTYDPSIHGPYNLETVAQSPNTNIGAGTWLFDTSSGANEDWVMFPMVDGLHRILQHNILFEGAQHDVVFTKTVGLLYEDIHEFDIETYYDAGYLGSVTLESTIGLNGLEADGFLSLLETTEWVDEPLDFIDADTIEWQYPFSVSDGVSIEIWTASSDIADIDLFLFYNDPVDGWTQMASSTSGTANEHVLVSNPADGQWLIGVLNWSGPAGHFDMYMEQLARAGGITVDVPVGPVDPYQPVTVDVYYDAALTLGENTGLLFVGPPEAPQLKEIPITITKLAEPEGDTWVTKDVDFDLHFVGDLVQYSIDLYNTRNAPVYVDLMDYIPEGLSFDSAAVSCPNLPCGAVEYHPANSEPAHVTYQSPIAMSEFTKPPESFEHGGDWPAGWTTQHNGATDYDWVVGDWDPHSGTYHASIRYSDDAPSDEWLISPPIEVPAGVSDMSFWVMTDTNWPGATMKLHVLDESDVVIDTLWDLILDEDWTTFIYRQKVLDTSAYAEQTVKFAWQYVGFDGQSARLDDIIMPSAEPQPAATIDLFVTVDEGSEGLLVENEAWLDVFYNLPHALPHELAQPYQFIHNDVAGVSFEVGGPDLSLSYKIAPDQVDIGEAIEYEIHLINNGTGVATVELWDPIPAGTTYLDHAPGPNFEFAYDAIGDAMSWNGTLDPGEEKVFNFRVTAIAGGVVNNVAEVSWNPAAYLEIGIETIVMSNFLYLPIIVVP